MRLFQRIIFLFLAVVFFVSLTGCDYAAYKTYYFNEEDYTDIWNLSGFSYRRTDTGLIFPIEIDGYDTKSFYCRYDEQIPLGEGIQIYLEISLPDKQDLTEELSRIVPMTIKCDEYFNSVSLDAYAVSLGENGFWEYVLADQEALKVYFIYLQDVPIEEIEFSHNFLPESYSRYSELPLRE